MRNVLAVCIVAVGITACGGGGGGGGTAATTPVAPVVTPTPIAVKATSYENQMAVGASGLFPTVPDPTNIVGLVQEPGAVGFFGGRTAFADFFQDGTLSALVMEPIYKGISYPGITTAYQINPPNSAGIGGADSPARLYFIHKNPGTGLWEDKTSVLIKDSGSLHACITPSFLEVADINKDGKPDILISCTGNDWAFPSDVTFAQSVPYLISKQYELLSQPDGTYKLVNIPVTSPQGPGIYAHQASLADIDGDGNLDIVYVDPHGNETPFIMWGHGDGTFTQDMTRFPADMLHKQIFAIRAIPINGIINLVVSGSVPTANATYNQFGFGAAILQFAHGAFTYTNQLVVPTVPGKSVTYALGLDYVYFNSMLYAYYVDSSYLINAIIKFDIASGQGTVVHSDDFTGRNFGGDGSGEITVYGSNIESMMAGCGPSSTSPTDFNYYACHFVTPL